MRLTLVAVQSLDGCLTRGSEPGTAFASAADQEWFRGELEASDAAIMGSATYLAARDRIRAGLRAGLRRVVLTRSPQRWQEQAVRDRLEFSDEPPEALVTRLRDLGHRRCALLGGGGINGLFLAADLVNTLKLTVEPLVFGGGVRLSTASSPAAWKLTAHRRLAGSTLLLCYERVQS
ncbi:MAG: dihydrofolate reductase [Puniceicoccaceae bacterium]|nr:MAG: dihydrofolate reductase [Puniceicoccaceae bacterium]